MWRDESLATKAHWKDRSSAVKVQHQREHPDYQYQPRKPHEKKRRMTKRKAELLASSSSSSTGASSSSTAAAATVTAADIQGPHRTITMPDPEFNIPAFDYYAGGNQAVFTYDAHQNPVDNHQLDLLDFMISNHNADAAHGLHAPLAGGGGAAVPAASTVLPTAINMAAPTPALPPTQFTLAQTHLSDFEISLEDALARELENMEHEQQNQGEDFVPAQIYNDLESQRFTEFLEQMPDHMWGMEFIN